MVRKIPEIATDVNFKNNRLPYIDRRISRLNTLTTGKHFNSSW